MKIKIMGLLCLTVIMTVFVSSCYDDDRYGELLTYQAKETIESLEVDLDIRHIEIIVTDDEFITLTYHEHENDTWHFSESDGKMTVKQDRKNSFRFFQFGTAEDELVELKIYLPKSFDGSMDLFTAVGRIEIVCRETMNLQALDIHTNVGKIMLENIVISGDLKADSSTGDVSIENIVSETIDISVSTGKVTIEDVQTSDMNVKNSTGSVKVTNSTISGSIEVDNSTGDIVLSHTTAISYDLQSSTGNITVTVFDQIDFSFDLETTLGDITVFGIDQGRKHVTQGDVHIKARVSTGSITIRNDE